MRAWIRDTDASESCTVFSGERLFRVVFREILPERRPLPGAIELLAALRRAELVAMQADRPTGGRGDAIVPFFG